MLFRSYSSGQPFPRAQARRVLLIVGMLLTLAGGLESNPLWAANFSDSFRWNATATDGTGLQQGDSTTLLWSFLPDGVLVDGQSSHLVSYLDGLHGAGPAGADLTLRPWFGAFSSGLDTISAKSGLTFIYQSDDGAPWGGLPSIGTRGDIRLAGIDLPTPGELGNAKLPTFGGDIRLDTANSSLGSLSTLQSVFQHEMGHALGLLHTSVPGTPILMNQGTLITEGPQFDDLSALVRLYGDRLEKGAGNDTLASAFDLGTLSTGAVQQGLVQLGLDAGDLPLLASQNDLVAIDSPTDVDLYRFHLAEPAEVTINLVPRGPAYTFVPEGATAQTTDASAQSNLMFDLLSSQPLSGNGEMRWIRHNLTSLGASEQLVRFDLPTAGDYYLRVATDGPGQQQFYELQLSASPALPSSSPVVFHDAFVAASNSSDPNNAIDTSGRQAAGQVDSPYEFTTSNGTAILDTAAGSNTDSNTEPAGNLLLSATAVGIGEAGPALAMATPMRNFAPQVADQRWLLTLQAEVANSQATPNSSFALLLNDQEADQGADEDSSAGLPASEAIELSFELLGNGDYLLVENGGTNTGEVHLTGVAPQPTAEGYKIELLVDETGVMPLVSLAVNGALLLQDEPIDLASEGRYFSFGAFTKLGAAAGLTSSAQIDHLQLVSLSDTTPGDFNYDGQVDAADYTLWRDTLGSHPLPGTGADSSGNGIVGPEDYQLWKTHFGSTGTGSLFGPPLATPVPEPSTIILLLVAGLWTAAMKNHWLQRRGRSARL